jgi:hypothetical protein
MDELRWDDAGAVMLLVSSCSGSGACAAAAAAAAAAADACPALLLQRQRRAVETVYEARPVPKDHQVPGMGQGAHHHIS